MYCSKEKMVGSACTSSHSSRCLSKSDWSGDYMYLGDVIPSSGLTIILIANFYILGIFKITCEEKIGRANLYKYTRQIDLLHIPH